MPPADYVALGEFTTTYSEPNNTLAMMGSTLHFTCFAGYFMSNGSEILTCGGTHTEHAHWMEDFPICPRKFLSPITLITITLMELLLY